MSKKTVVNDEKAERPMFTGIETIESFNLIDKAYKHCIVIGSYH